MNRIAKTALAVALTVGLTVAGPGSAFALGLTAGKTYKPQGGGIGCCVGAV